MNKTSILTFTILFIGLKVFSMESASDTLIPEKYEIKPIATIFSSFYFSSIGGTNKSGFTVTRAHLGAKCKFNKTWNTKLYFDVANPENGSKMEYVAFLKNATLSYNKGNLTFDFGLVSLKQFCVQEKSWAHRYIMKSFDDQYKFGESTDFGGVATYKINKMFEIDGAFINGEGFKVAQADNTYTGGLGLTIKPVKNFVLRGYSYYSKKAESQITLSGFAGYEIENKIKLGAEYNYKQNYKYSSDMNMYGYSAYATFYYKKKYALFGRFDMLQSNTLENKTDPWNLGKNGKAVVGGLEHIFNDDLKMAITVYNWLPDESIQEKQLYTYLNLYYNF
jgi:hypothetical protein